MKLTIFRNRRGDAYWYVQDGSHITVAPDLALRWAREGRARIKTKEA